MIFLIAAVSSSIQIASAVTFDRDGFPQTPRKETVPYSGIIDPSACKCLDFGTTNNELENDDFEMGETETPSTPTDQIIDNSTLNAPWAPKKGVKNDSLAFLNSMMPKITVKIDVSQLVPQHTYSIEIETIDGEQNKYIRNLQNSVTLTFVGNNLPDFLLRIVDENGSTNRFSIKVPSTNCACLTRPLNQSSSNSLICAQVVNKGDAKLKVTLHNYTKIQVSSFIKNGSTNSNETSIK